VRRLIVTGDDFGLCVPVNEAIEEAHRGGALTAASLMVGAEAAGDAVERARRLPSLRVGLHLVLVEGRPVLPPEEVPDLVDERGELSPRLVRAGFRLFFLPRVRRQVEAEMRAQFQAFRATGLALDHANAHNHMHLHPTLLELVTRVGREFGLRAVRLPREPPLRSWRAAGRGLRPRLLSALLLAPLLAHLRRRLRRAGLASNDFLFGMNDSGRMEAPLVARLLEQLPEGVTEMYFHPATRRCPEIDRRMADYRHEAELAALTSPAVWEKLERADVRRVAFSDL
jgi:hopanoid biosynthesis associated protein HpnK